MKRLFFFLFSFAFVSTAYAESSSFTRLMAAGQSVECSFAKNDGSQKGTIYVAGEKMRGEILMSQSSGAPMHMIRNTEKMYTWGGEMGESQGMVMPANVQGGSLMGTSMPTSSANMDEEMDFTCKPWSADASQFEPPSDVTFQDLGALMSGLAAAQAGNS